MNPAAVAPLKVARPAAAKTYRVRLVEPHGFIHPP